MPTDALTERAVHPTVLVRLIEDPRRTPGSGRDLAPSDLDADQVRQIAGFITRIHFESMRETLPLTVQALAATGLDTAFFADIATELGERRRAGMDDDERSGFFVDALLNWLDTSDDHRLVADVLAHELTMGELAEHEPVPPPASEVTVRVASRPRLRDGVRLLRLTVHPPDVVDPLPATPAAAVIDRSPRCYVYVPTAAGVRVKGLDPSLAPVVKLADGSRTVAEIVEAADVRVAPTELAAVFRRLVGNGLADVDEPSPS